MTKDYIRDLSKRYRASRAARLAFVDALRQPPILIYQMGKVGSSTIYQSLRMLPVAGRVLHLHFLSDEIETRLQHHVRKGIARVPSHFYLGRQVKRILKNAGEVPIKIISLVRDPIAIMLSGIFENPHLARPDLLRADGEIDPDMVMGVATDALSDPEGFRYVNEWFDRELKAVFGIDVFSEPFPGNVGYKVYERPPVQALVLRLEDLSIKGPGAIARYLDLPGDLTLINHNLRVSESDGDLYRRVKNNIRLNTGVLDRIYAGKMAAHFYDPEMIAGFRRKWSGEEA